MENASSTKDMSAWKSGLVTIVMPAHNSQASLSESVQSVLAQTYTDWELIIVDDASSDGTLALAGQFAAGDPRIRVLPLEQNVGVAEARNRGIDAARGQYLAFLDSDDLWLPHKLETQIDFMQFQRSRLFVRSVSPHRPRWLPEQSCKSSSLRQLRRASPRQFHRLPHRHDRSLSDSSGLDAADQA